MWQIPRLIISLRTGPKAPWHLTDRVQMKQLWGAKPVLEIAFKSDFDRPWLALVCESFWRGVNTFSNQAEDALGAKNQSWDRSQPNPEVGSAQAVGADTSKRPNWFRETSQSRSIKRKFARGWWIRRWRRWVVSLWPRREVWMLDGLVAVPPSPGDPHGLVGWEGLGAGAKRRRYGMRFRAILRWDRYHSGSITTCPQIPTAHYLSDQGRLILTFVWRQQFINGLMFVEGWGGGACISHVR